MSAVLAGGLAPALNSLKSTFWQELKGLEMLLIVCTNRLRNEDHSQFLTGNLQQRSKEK